MRSLNVRFVALSATGLLLAAGSASNAQATSEKRIPIRKEGGEVALPPRIDTVMVYRTDTVRLNGRIDTVSVTHMRVDTVRVETTVNVPMPAPIPMPTPVVFPSGVYAGVGAGLSGPAGSLFQSNNFGFSGQAQLGWQRLHSPVGLRIDANVARFNQDAGYAAYGVHGRAANFSADLKLALPTHLLGLSPRFGLYGIGGGTLSTFDDLQMDLEPGVAGGVGPTNTAPPTSDWQHQWGWNAGGGASLSWGHKELFVESRLIQFRSTNALSARQVPIVLGMNWY